MIRKKKSKILTADKYIWHIKRNINSEKEFTKPLVKIKKPLVYIKYYLIDSDGNIYLTLNSLIEINNMMNSSKNITLRKVHEKPYGFDKILIDKDLIEYKFYQIIDQFNETRIANVKFYSILLNKIHLFYDWNEKTSKILVLMMMK